MAMTGRRSTMTFDVTADPVSVTLDPQTTLLFEAGAFDRNRAGPR